MKMFASTSIFGPRIYQYLAAMSAAFCMLASEMHFSWNSASLPVLVKGGYHIQFTESEASWIALALLPGTVLGAIMAGKLTGHMGRKRVILLTSVPLSLGWIMTGLAHHLFAFFTARFIAGISFGLSFSTVPMYLGEIAEPKIRGKLSSFGPLSVVLGILLINVIVNYLPINTAAYVSCIFPATAFLTFLWMPESPLFLLQQNQLDEAKSTLETLCGKGQAEKELDRIAKNVIDENEDMNLFYYFIFERVNRKAAIVAYGLISIQQFCGTTAIAFYCKAIFEEQEQLLPANISIIVYFSVQFFVSFIAIFIVDIFGRKPLLITSTTGCSITLFLLSAFLFVKESTNIGISFLRFVPLLMLFMNALFLGIGLRNIPLVMMGEVFSPRIKPIALCFGTIYYSLLSLISTKMFYFINTTCGMYASFLAFGILAFFGIFFVIFFVPETRGIRLEAIQMKLALKRGIQVTSL